MFSRDFVRKLFVSLYANVEEDILALQIPRLHLSEATRKKPLQYLYLRSEKWERDCRKPTTSIMSSSFA